MGCKCCSKKPIRPEIDILSVPRLSRFGIPRDKVSYSYLAGESPYLLVYVKDYHSGRLGQLRLEQISVEASDATHIDLISFRRVLPNKSEIDVSGSYRLSAYGVSWVLLPNSPGTARAVYYQVMQEWGLV